MLSMVLEIPYPVHHLSRFLSYFSNPTLETVNYVFTKEKKLLYPRLRNLKKRKRWLEREGGWIVTAHTCFQSR